MPWRRIWMRTRREASNATAAAWVMKPKRLKWSSPWEVRATPEEMRRTMTSSLRFGSAMRVAQEMSRIATGVKA
jgi:hypothetical protein